MTTARLRLVFAAVAIALAIPGALLVRRALASVALEREARERAVAERTFDEMERALSELLRQEEARPASDYEFASGASPLREKPADPPAALGWFQIEADGHVTVPPWASGVEALGEELAAGGARYEVARAAAGSVGLQRTPERMKPTRHGAPRAPTLATPESVEAAPGLGVPGAAAPPSTQSVKDAAGAGDRQLHPTGATPRADLASGDAVVGEARTDAYDALAKLNTGAKEREQRKQRVYVQEQAALASVPAPSAKAELAGGSEAQATGAVRPSELADDSRARSEELVAQAMSAPTPSESSEPTVEGDAIAPSGERSSASARRLGAASAEAPLKRAAKPTAPGAGEPVTLGRLRATAPQPAAGSELVRVIVDPMRGQLSKSGELLLVRSAWIGDRGVRQGVVLSVAALERSLSGAALDRGALPGARVRFAPAAELLGRAQAQGLRTFSHRYAEPFEALAAELSFTPFANDGARSVYWLAALFAFAGVGGLFAVYRMTAIALHFAERRSNFADAVSHELKTPLTAIRLYAEMLRDGLVSGDEKRREYYGSIAAETERLSRLINNVLEFSRLEKGARSLEVAAGDVAPVVREAVELLRPHAAGHGLALELAVEDALPPVRFERDALLQVVFNLVDNAVKYGRGEPAKIEIACRRAGECVAVVVRDHGPGVPREELGRILEPFYRRGDELTRSAAGAGIGLALVRSLADQMGAALRIANAEGGGLTVTVELSGNFAGKP